MFLYQLVNVAGKNTIKIFFQLTTEIFKITNIDLKNGRISGSIKTTQPSPEENFFNLGNRSVPALISKEHKDNILEKHMMV